MSEHKSRRRDASQKVGFAKFPTDKYENSGEGGVFVRLVVLDDDDYEKKWSPCCGGLNEFFYDECFIGDDLFDIKAYFEESCRGHSECSVLETQRKEMERKYFPNLDQNNPSQYEYVSKNFLCVMTIGAAGWSSGMWVCTKEDLTEDGLALYESIEKLYPGREIRLLTFLDT